MQPPGRPSVVSMDATSSPSAYPPTKLTWFVNDIEARDPFVQESLSKTDNNLYYSETRLTVKVSSTQFQAGEMRIKCVASLIEEPIKADKSSNRDGIVLEVIKLPEAMKLQTENIFDGELSVNLLTNPLELNSLEPSLT